MSSPLATTSSTHTPIRSAEERQQKLQHIINNTDALLDCLVAVYQDCLAIQRSDPHLDHIASFLRHCTLSL